MQEETKRIVTAVEHELKNSRWCGYQAGIASYLAFSSFGIATATTAPALLWRPTQYAMYVLGSLGPRNEQEWMLTGAICVAGALWQLSSSKMHNFLAYQAGLPLRQQQK